MRVRPDIPIRRGLSLPRRAVRRLVQVGIFARPEVSLEHQHLARRYVIRGVESGGAIAEIGRYVSFASEHGEPLTYLHPIDAVGVNGLHAVVVASLLVRVEMFRAGRTCELLITKHWPGQAENGKRPPLESRVLFRGVHGYLEVDLRGKAREVTRAGLPIFYSRGGEPMDIPAEFQAAVEAVTRGVGCLGCFHCHYLVPPVAAVTSPIISPNAKDEFAAQEEGTLSQERT